MAATTEPGTELETIHTVESHFESIFTCAPVAAVPDAGVRPTGPPD